MQTLQAQLRTLLAVESRASRPEPGGLPQVPRRQAAFLAERLMIVNERG